MATQKENLLSPGNLTGIERNTFSKQRQNGLKKRYDEWRNRAKKWPVLPQTDFSTLRRHQHLRAMQLQQHWQELKERELKAKQHNWQLMMQFEEAQNTLREMMTLTATMKTIRMEYERYLKENSPIWQQQLQEQTQAAQKKRMEDYLRSCLKNTQRMTKSSSEQPLDPQGLAVKTQNIAPPQSQNNHLDYNQDGSPHLPFMQTSRMIYPQSQTAGFPIRVPHQPQHSSHAQPTIPQPQMYPFPHLASTLGPCPPGWGALQPDCPWFSIADAAGLPSDFETLWGHLHREEEQAAEEKAETSRSFSSQRGEGGRSRRSHSSQELDVKPVRLSSGHAESSESSKESDQASSKSRRKRKEKRGRAQHASSEREALSSQGSSGTSSANIFAAATARSSESDTSSEKGSSRRERRSEGLGVGSLKSEKEIKKRSRRKGDESRSHKDGDQSFGEEVKSQTENSRNEKAEYPECGSRMEEESGSVSVDIDKGSLKETEKEEGENSELSSMGEREEEQEKDLGDEDDVEKENSKINEEQEERVVKEAGDEPSDRKNTSEEEDDTGAEDEMEEQESEKEEDGLNGEDELRKQGSASSQDEEDSEGGEGRMEKDRESDEEGGSDDEEEQRRDKAGESEEEEDSDDSIIAPQENRTKKIYVFPEAVEDEEEDEEEEDKESETASSDDNSNDDSDDDIEHLLAPKEELKDKENKEKSSGEKPKANGDKVEIFQVESHESTKTDLQSDSDEFDHFYD